MPDSNPSPNSFPWKSLYLGLGILAFLTATQRFLAFTVPEGATGAMRIHWPFWRTFLSSLVRWAVVIPFAHGIARLVAKKPLDGPGRGEAWAFHGMTALLISPLFLILDALALALVSLVLDGWGATRDLLTQISLGDFASGALAFPVIYGGLALLFQGWESGRRARNREARALQLERRLAEAQLQLLQLQLNPHFLFNTLNGVASLIHRDPDTAEERLLDLTDFLREALEDPGKPEVPLSRELAVVARYLALERMRFPHRVSLELEVESEACMARVPAFMLQPLVENALHHGVGSSLNGGAVRIRGWVEGALLRIEVADDGAGPAQPGHGLGLSNLRSRLSLLYGPSASLEAGPKDEGGFRVDLTLPYTPEAS